MIKAQLQKANGELSLSVKGHAGSAPKGQDLVCCAVSTLCFSFLQYLKEAEKRCHAKLLEQHFAPGELYLRAKYWGEPLPAAFTLLRLGLEELERKYGEFLEVKG